MYRGTRAAALQRKVPIDIFFSWPVRARVYVHIGILYVGIHYATCVCACIRESAGFWPFIGSGRLAIECAHRGCNFYKSDIYERGTKIMHSNGRR